MLVTLDSVLSAADIARLRPLLEAAPWSDGQRTAGSQARHFKHNEQLPSDCEAAVAVRQTVLQALDSHARFFSAALPKKVFTPRINRYQGEGHYGMHYDNAILRRADETLRARFSPQITAEAGHILAELTENKYPRVLLEPDMHLSVREADGQVMRPAAAMSCGTADQMYLALRLAMCRRLLPPDAPMVLDDALVNFDPARTRAALRVLREEPRQILLFTCRPLTQEEE